MDADRTPNRLIREKSPYLLQHAHNPVDWYPWGDEAFARARSEQKPIFLSVGYSTCHWCHVMEKESFESEEIAALLNRLFVCIKIDREERPDVDRVYMSALHTMGQNGGWPMSMFLTPDLRPFYGGTYFPPVTRYGRIGFPDLLQRIHEAWSTDRRQVLESAAGLTGHLAELMQSTPPGRTADGAALDLAFAQFARSYDAEAGGFGGAPKFPRPAVFTFLLRSSARSGNPDSLGMTTTTLRRMAVGGVYDQLGGGFHRYSVDAAWRVPHFEKMLYDQAQLASVYVDAYLMTKDTFFAEVATEVLEYVLRDLTLPEGGFCSAEDADSMKYERPGEKGEGAFYVWTKKEIDTVLPQDESRVFALAYGVEEEGNAAVDPHHEFTGKNILYRARTAGEAALQTGLLPDAVTSLLRSARKRLLAERSRRPRPGLDDKVLTSWNGLMIGACAKAASGLGSDRYLQAAVRAAEFVLGHLHDPAGNRLRRRFRDGEARHEAHLEDYAFLVNGFLDLYEASLEVRWLRHAVFLTETQIALFEDKANGGFYDTSGEDPSILIRTREQYDGAEPSGNSVAAMNLLRLAHFTGDMRWRAIAERVLATFGPVLAEQPQAVPYMAAALGYSLGSPKEIVITGKRGAPGTEALLQEVRSRYLPESVLLFAETGSTELATISPFAAALAVQGEGGMAYVCEGQTCQLPTGDPAVLRKLLDGRETG